MNRVAPTDAPIQELLSKRWSPYAFDPERTVAAEDLHALFDVFLDILEWCCCVVVKSHLFFGRSEVHIEIGNGNAF